MKKKLHPKIAENSSHKQGGRFDLGFEKLQVTFAEYYRRNKKSAAGENFRNRNYFCTKNRAKMQKNGQQKIHPPPGGGGNVFILGILPGRGDYRKSPPLQGGFTPFLKIGHRGF